MVSADLNIYPTWRSQLLELLFFAVSFFIAVELSKYLPWSVIEGPLFTFHGVTYVLSLPLLLMVPTYFLLRPVVSIYDVQYVLTSSGIEAKEGYLHLRAATMTIRYKDVRSVEVKQSLIERFLGIGTIEIGTAATSGVEISLKGIAAPHTIQEFIAQKRTEVVSPLLETEEAANASH